MDCEDCNPPPPTFVQNLRERLVTIVKLLIEKVLGAPTDGSSRLNEDCRAPCCPCGRPITKEDILDQLIQLTRLCEASNVEQELPCIGRDKPELKRKRPHESVSERDLSLQHTSKDRRHESSVVSEDVQKIGNQVNIKVTNCDCGSESISVNEKVLKKTSYTDLVSSSSEIRVVEDSRNKNGAETKTDATSDVWMQNYTCCREWPWQSPSQQNLLRDAIKARVHSIVNIAANKFTCFKQPNKSPINDDNICICHVDSEQNLKLETLELAINATDELRNEMKNHTTDDKVVEQISECKSHCSDNMQQLLADIIKIDILELIADVVHTLRVKTMPLTEISERQNFDEGVKFGSLALNESNARVSDDNVRETFSNIIKKIDYDVSTLLPSTEEILMENILEIVKSTKMKMNNIVGNIDDPGSSSQNIKSITSQEMFNQIIDIIIQAATELKDQELFPEKQIDVDVQSRSNLEQQHIEEEIKQSVSKLISSTSDKYIQESILGTSEHVDISVHNWYPPDSVEKEVRLQTLNAVISAAEKLKLSPPGNNTIAIHHSMMEIILHCVSDMKKLLCVLNLITETLNDLKTEAEKNKIKSFTGSGTSQGKASEKSFHDFKKHRPCMCSCCKSLFPLLHKKGPRNQIEPFEDNAGEKKIQTTENNLVLNLKPHSEISDNEFDQESVINRRYTAGLIEDIIKLHTQNVSSDSLVSSRSSEHGSIRTCKEICSDCQCTSSSLADEDEIIHNQTEPFDAFEDNSSEKIIQATEKNLVLNLKSHSEISDNEFDQESVINRRYTAGLMEEIIKLHTQNVSSDSLISSLSSELGSIRTCKEICPDCQCTRSSLADEDEIIHDHMQKRETNLGVEDEFEKEPVINRRYIQELLEEIIQGNIKEVALDSLPSPSVSQSSKTNKPTRNDKPCNYSCSDCQCQITQKKSSLIKEDPFEQIPVIYRSNEGLIKGEIQNHFQERNGRLTDRNSEVKEVTKINRNSTENSKDTKVHWQKLESGPSNSLSFHSTSEPRAFNKLFEHSKHCDKKCLDCQCQISEGRSKITDNGELGQGSVINRRHSEGQMQEIIPENVQHVSSYNSLKNHNTTRKSLTPGVNCGKLACLSTKCQKSHRDSSPAHDNDLEHASVINRRFTLEIIDKIMQDHVQDISPNMSLPPNTTRKPLTSDVNCGKLTCLSTKCQKSHRDSSPAHDNDLEHASVINRRFTLEIIDKIMQDHVQDISPNMSLPPNFNSSETSIPFEAGVHCNKTCSECQCQNTSVVSRILTDSEDLEQESVINRRYTKELIEEIIQDHTQDVSSYSSFHPSSKSSENRIFIGAGDNASSNIFVQHPSLEETIKTEIIRRLINILNTSANTLGKIQLADKQDIQIRTLDFIINVTDELKNEIRDKKNETKCATENVSCNCKEKIFLDRIKMDILGMVTDIVNSLKSKVEESDKNVDENVSQSFGSNIRNLNFEGVSVVLRPTEEIIMEKILEIVKSIIFQFDNFPGFLDDSGSSSQRRKSITSQETFSQIIDIIIHIANQFKKELLLEHSTPELPTDKNCPLQETTELEQEPIIDAVKPMVSHLIASITNIEEILQVIVTNSEDDKQDTSITFNDWPSGLRHSIEVVANLEAINAIINAAEKLKKQSVCKLKTTCNSMQKTIVNDSDEIKILGVLNHLSDVLNDLKEEESQKNDTKNSQVQERVFKVPIEDSKKLHTCTCTLCKSNYPSFCKKGMKNHIESIKNSQNISTARNNKSKHFAKDQGSHGEISGDKTDESVSQSHDVTCGKSKCSKSKRKSSQIEESNLNMITDDNESVHIHDLNNSLTNNQVLEQMCVPCSPSSRAECSMFQESFHQPSQSFNESDAEMNTYEKPNLHPPSPIPCVKSTCPLFQKIPFHESQSFKGTVHDEVAKDTSDLTMDITHLNQKPTTSDQRCHQSCSKHSIAKSQKETLSQTKSDDGGEKNCKEYCDKLKWYIHKLAMLSKQELSKQKTTDSADKAKETKKCCSLSPDEEGHLNTNSETISSATESFLDKLLTICCKCEYPIEKLNNLLHKIAKAVENTSNGDFQKLLFETSTDNLNKNEEKVVQNTIQTSKTLFLDQHFDKKPIKSKCLLST